MMLLRALRAAFLAAATIVAGVGADAAGAQIRKSCRPIENDRMVCSEVSPAGRPAKANSDPAPPPWKSAVAKAVLDGRCTEARRIALENGDLETAQQAKSLCVAR